MQDVEEGGKCVARDLANLRLVHERFVEELSGIVLLSILSICGVLAVLLLFPLRGCSRDVEAHLNELILRAA